jgi:hypothetical protein
MSQLTTDKEVPVAESMSSQDQHQTMTQGEQPGGRSSRGPEVTPGGQAEPQGLVPPYERPDSEDAAQAAQEGVHKAFRADEHAPEPGPEPPVSEEEREGVSSTDTAPEAPLGVGESSSTGGEEYAARTGGEDERETVGTQGQSQRPVGTSEPEDATGVDPEEPVTGGPTMPSGDQGG